MGARVAIQCKFYDPEHVVSKKDIDSFTATSSSEEFSRRLWVSTSLREWGANAEAQVQHLSPPFDTLDELVSLKNGDFPTQRHRNWRTSA